MKIRERIAQTRVCRMLNSIIMFLLKNTHNHYLFNLPEKASLITRAIHRLYFGPIQMEQHHKDKLSELGEKGIIIYANKYKVQFNLIYSYLRFQDWKIPYPTVGFDFRLYGWQSIIKLFRVYLAKIDFFLKNFKTQNPYNNGYMTDLLQSGHHGFLSLVDEEAFYKRFIKSKTDPIQYLLKVQSGIDKPIFIVPQLFFFSIKPDRTNPGLVDFLQGSLERPGKIRRLVSLVRRSKKVFVDIAEPVNLKDYLNQPHIKDKHLEYQALSLRFHLIDRINRHRQSVTGPIIKAREEIKEGVLSSFKLQSFMKSHAKETDTSLPQVHKKADAYVEEIAANYSMKWIRIYDIVLTWMLKHIFEGMIVDTDGLAKVKQAASDAPLVLIPCHKSHLDYLILSYIFHHNKMPCPHIAAGKNLSFWPLGTIFRGGGAFFLRRTFKGKPLYAKVFGEYMEKLLEEGFNIEFFIEGGRSRTGKLLSPKMGILSQLLDGYKNGACPDLMFCPINIGYDRVLEEKSYLHEIEGGAKNPESISGVVKARKFLKKRYGKVYVNFSEPMSLKRYLAETGLDVHQMEKEDKQALCADLGSQFITAIGDAGLVTPHGIVASALLNTPRKRLEYDSLVEDLETYLNFLSSQGVRLADTLMAEPGAAFDKVLDDFIQRGFIEAYDNNAESLKDTNFLVKENKRAGLEYYKNNSISAFLPAAYTALSILKLDAFQFTGVDLHEQYAELQQMFINDFPDTANHIPDERVRRTVKAFIDDAVLVPHPSLPDTYNITAAGFRKLKLYARFVKTYLESYRVTLAYFKKASGDDIEMKERLKKIHSLGTKMFRKSDLDHSEALSRENFKNASTYYLSKGIRGKSDKEAIDMHNNLIQDYLDLIDA